MQRDDNKPGVATDITIADWIEVIRAENREIPGVHRTLSPTDRDWLIDPLIFDELIVLLEVEYLKQARGHALIRGN